MENLLTARDVAELLRIDESTVYKWADQGPLRYVDLGREGRKRCLRFRREDLEELIEKKLVAND